MPTRGGCERGITWMEVVILIVILSLLMSILVPALQGARRQAKQAICLSNMKNVGVGASIYCEDNSGFFPVACDDNQTGRWITLLTPYTNRALSYRCPADKSADWHKPSEPPSLQRINDRRRSYATNAYTSLVRPRYANRRGASQRCRYLKRGLILSPSETVYLAECAETSGAQVATAVIHADQWLPNRRIKMPVWPSGGEIALGRHTGDRENYTFADGHAKSMPFSATFAFQSDTWSLEQDRWNPAFAVHRRDN